MSTNPRDLQFGFTAPGQTRGVFGTCDIRYSSTATVSGQFTVHRRILRDDWRTEDLGVVLTVPFRFEPQHFGLDPVTLQPAPGAPHLKVWPGRNPNTNAPTNRNWTALDLVEILYSAEVAELGDFLDAHFPLPQAQQPAEPGEP